MWCPKCKNEYVDGITTCVDCGCDLVPELTEEQESMNPSDFPMDEMISQAVSSMPEADYEEEDFPSAPAPAHAFVSKATKREDVKSTAYTFVIVGAGGIILLALFYLGVFPIQVASYMKILIGLVMGAMFLIFLIIGIRSMGDLKDLQKAAEEEDALYEDITTWFQSSFSSKDIDAAISTDVATAQIYFSRYETMSKLITEKYSNLEDAFLDHVIEELYTELFPE